MTAPPAGGYPLVGHVPAYLRDRLAFFQSRADDSGAAVRCRLGPRGGYLLNDPEDIRHVLVANHRNYVKARRIIAPRATWGRGQGLLTSSGEEHRHKRRMMQPAFRQPLMERIAERSRVNAERLADDWSDGEQVDVAAAMTTLARRNILEALFEDAPDDQLQRLAAEMDARRRFFGSMHFSAFPLPEYLPTRTNLGYLRSVRRLDAAVYPMLEARRRAAQQPDDLLSMLMEATYEDGTTMGDRELRDEVLMVSFTGHDTVAGALAWTFLELARHPEADARLADELRSAEEPEYAAGVVRETLRLYPPTWVFARVALGDETLPGGARIAAGSHVYLCPYVVHRNPGLWPEPERFDPDRFLDGADDGRPRYAYFPFGGGPHVCIGEALAITQVVTVLSTVAARHRLTLAPGQEIAVDPGISLHPKGEVRMRVEPRG